MGELYATIPGRCLRIMTVLRLLAHYYCHICYFQDSILHRESRRTQNASGSAYCGQKDCEGVIREFEGDSAGCVPVTNFIFILHNRLDNDGQATCLITVSGCLHLLVTDWVIT